MKKHPKYLVLFTKHFEPSQYIQAISKIPGTQDFPQHCLMCDKVDLDGASFATFFYTRNQRKFELNIPNQFVSAVIGVDDYKDIGFGKDNVLAIQNVSN